MLEDLASFGFDAEWDVFSAEEEGAPPHAARRARAAPADPPDEAALREALEEHAAVLAARFDALREAIVAAQRVAPPGASEGGARYSAWEHHEGVAALLLAHLVEMWCLRLFGPARLEEELRLLAEHATIPHSCA